MTIHVKDEHIPTLLTINIAMYAREPMWTLLSIIAVAVVSIAQLDKNKMMELTRKLHISIVVFDL